jgi:hypothetical protein
MPCIPLARAGRSARPAGPELARQSSWRARPQLAEGMSGRPRREIQTAAESLGDSGLGGKGELDQLTPILSSKSELFCTLLRAKSLPCHSYEYTGGGGYPPRVHISLNPKHLAFPASRQPSVACQRSARVGGSLSPNSLPAFTYEITFPQVLPRLHIRFSPQPKSLRAFTYENRGGGGSASSHFLFSIFHFHLHLRSEGPCRDGITLVTIPLFPHLIPGKPSSHGSAGGKP